MESFRGRPKNKAKKQHLIILWTSRACLENKEPTQKNLLWTWNPDILHKICFPQRNTPKNTSFWRVMVRVCWSCRTSHVNTCINSLANEWMITVIQLLSVFMFFTSLWGFSLVSVISFHPQINSSRILLICVDEWMWMWVNGDLQ